MPVEGFLSRFLGCGLAACFMFSTYLVLPSGSSGRDQLFHGKR